MIERSKPPLNIYIYISNVTKHDVFEMLFCSIFKKFHHILIVHRNGSDFVFGGVDRITATPKASWDQWMASTQSFEDEFHVGAVQ